MKIVIPQEVNQSTLTTTNVANEVANWSAGTYSKGQQAVYGEHVYEALSSTTERPDNGAAASPPTWVQLGRSNVWRMFRDGTDSVSTAPTKIDVTIAAGSAFSAVAVLGAAGVSVEVTLTNPIEGVVYQETKSLVDIGVDDWWQYFFLGYEEATDVYFTGIPAYTGDLNIVINAVGPSVVAECGRVVLGLEYDIGVTVDDVQSRLEDFSRKERDAFGNLVLIPRRTIRIVDYEFLVEPGLVDAVQRRFRQLAARPALYIGHIDMPEAIVFGVFQQFSTIINGHTITECSASVEEF